MTKEGGKALVESIDQYLEKEAPRYDWAERIIAGLPIPTIAPALATWIGQRAHQKGLERVRETLVEVEQRLMRLEGEAERGVPGQEWAELATNTLRIVAREPVEEKRHRFAQLLAHGARQDPTQETDEAPRMVRILDQLEYAEVKLLHRLFFEKPYPNVSHYWIGGSGATRRVSRADLNSPSFGGSLLQLRSHGLVHFDQRITAEAGTEEFESLFDGAVAKSGPDAHTYRPVIITRLGLDFFRWIYGADEIGEERERRAERREELREKGVDPDVL